MAIILLILAASGSTAFMQGSAAKAGGLDPRIKPPAAQRYKAVRDARKWENPYLMVGPDSIVVRAKGLAGLKIVPVEDLEQTLTELPVTAWPYGRVVAVQENGNRADQSDDKPIADNVAAARATLKKLGVTFDKWPS